MTESLPEEAMGIAASEDAEQSAGEAHNRSFTVVLMSGRQQEVSCSNLADVASLEERLAREFGLKTSQACRLLDAEGNPLSSSTRIKEIWCDQLMAIVFTSFRFNRTRPENFTTLSVSNFGNMSDKYMTVSEDGRVACNEKQEDGRVEFTSCISPDQLPVKLRILMPDSSGYSHYFYVYAGSHNAAVEANQEGEYSVTVSKDSLAAQRGSGAEPTSSPLPPEMQDLPLHLGIYLYSKGSAMLVAQEGL
ncbi:unnamed protein product [Effrenium voratum]|nr:unnamed protein product [Effrenium voratum]